MFKELDMNSAVNRITFSIPNDLNLDLENLKAETKKSKTELINLAIKEFIERRKKEQIDKAMELMSKEYLENSNLTDMTILDSEEFL